MCIKGTAILRCLFIPRWEHNVWFKREHRWVLQQRRDAGTRDVDDRTSRRRSGRGQAGAHRRFTGRYYPACDIPVHGPSAALGGWVHCPGDNHLHQVQRNRECQRHVGAVVHGLCGRHHLYLVATRSVATHPRGRVRVIPNSPTLILDSHSGHSAAYLLL